MRILAGTPAYSSNPQNAPGPRLTPPSTRFTTIVGLPKTIALQFERGKVVRSRYSGKDEMMYTLTTGEKAYFPLAVGEAIDSLTLAPGQPFTVCHHGGGNWDVDRAPLAPPSAPAQPLPARPSPPTPPLPPAASLHSSAAQAPLQRMNGAGETAADLYLEHFQSAIDIVLAGVPLANAKGLMVAPTFEDIRCIATHLAIARERRL
jgi:hypothetical protein